MAKLELRQTHTPALLVYWLLPVLLVIFGSKNVVDCRSDQETNVATNQLNPTCQALKSRPKCCSTNSNNQESFEWHESNCFRAAVYEHYRNDSYVPQDWRKTVEVNIRDFAEAAKSAANNAASIIVFPEDGILIGKREFIEPALPELPDPDQLDYTNNNPCTHSDSFPGDPHQVLRNLSCIARDNNLYVAANFGTKETCKYTGEKLPDGRICPPSGLFAYNTNVVLTSNGTFLKRYRKANLFVEIFDRSPGLETVYFDTPFGRFGIFTCFDMLFRKPAVELVEKYNVDTILFPTLWYDELPLLSAIQFQDGWSDRHQVNLLAANRHNRPVGSIGSGIYSGNHLVYTSASSTASKSLILATIPKRPRELTDCELEFNVKQIDSAPMDTQTQEYRYKNYTLGKVDSIYLLSKQEDIKTVCRGDVCCTIDYKLSLLSPPIEPNKLVLIVRDNLRQDVFMWYEQVCSLATLAKPFDGSEEALKSIEFSPESSISFERLSLEGNFTTRYVYPIAAYSVSELVERTKRHFQCDHQSDKQTSCKLSYTGNNEKPIYSFGMFARPYERDQMPPGYWN